MKILGGVWAGLWAVCALSVGCNVGASGEADGEATNPESAVVTDPIVIAELDEKVNLYAQALLDNDVVKLDGMVSNEVKTRVSQMKSDISGFSTKMGSALRTTLEQRAIDATNVVGLFAVTRVVKDGAAVRVELSMGGNRVPKPFYFVQEGGDYKLNVLAPGFTKPRPAGSAAGRETYYIANYSPSPYLVGCDGGGPVQVPKATFEPGTTIVRQYGGANIACNDTACGWWTGSKFYADSGTPKCDYNSWGEDGRFDFYGHFWCNDAC